MSDKLKPTCNQLATDCISRQEAIDEIDEWIKAFLENGHKESAADARLIQDGIIQLPSAQPEIEERMSETEQNVPNDDFISRKRAIDSVKGIGRLATLPDNDAVIRMSAVEYVLYNLPFAQPERKNGEWISFCRGKVCNCNVCHKGYDHTYEFIEEWNYCPNCGAKMER